MFYFLKTAIYQIFSPIGQGIRACADYRADPKKSAPVWATLEPSLMRCGRSPLKIDAQNRARALNMLHVPLPLPFPGK
ncbi:hypothetical protein HaLaN_14171 [Haematococcus lacustris]|uniref:Uncharacterized protein n=1 Tax=Haematococcus lacustris TaxID=44745 RepID=A0A699ZEB9_HAELA|nr:hypothetical protein HaLaN_14171 [Haematococcus lacustris]